MARRTIARSLDETHRPPEGNPKPFRRSVRIASETLGQIDHRLLADGYEADAWPVEVLYQEYHAGREDAGDVDRRSPMPPLQGSAVAGIADGYCRCRIQR